MAEIIQIYQFQCDECDFVTDSSAYFSTHQRVRHREEGRVYSCDICFQTFTFSWGVKLHKEDLHHNETFKCEHCSLITNSQRNIERHMKQAHFPGCDILDKCNICGKEVKRKNLKRHEQEHQRPRRRGNSSSDQFSCKQCNYTTTTSTYLKMHVLKKHPSYKLKCDHCSFVTAFEAKLNIHTIRNHASIQCDTCDFRTNVKSKMQTHKKLHPPKCKHCSFTSVSDAHFKKHLVNEHSETIKCEFHINFKKIKCDFETNEFKLFEDHRTTEHKSTFYNCRRCDFIGFNKNDISPHSTQNHKQFICKTCKRTCLIRFQLQKHIEDSHGVPKCPLCSVSFPNPTQNQSLQDHLRKVHFKCDKCEELAFVNIKQLYNHLKRIHKLPCGYKIDKRKKTPINCSSCNFTTLSNKQLRLHKSKEHTNQLHPKLRKHKSTNRRKQSKETDKSEQRSISMEAEEQTPLVVPSPCLGAEETSEYVETDELVKDKAETLLRDKGKQQQNFENSLDKTEGNALLKVSFDCLESEGTSEYVETDDLMVPDKAEPLMSYKEEEQNNLESSFTGAEGMPQAPSSIETEMTEEYVEMDDLLREKVESQIPCKEEDSYQSLQAVTYATYVCSFDSCSFMTTVMNDKIRAEHYLSCHPTSVSNGEQQEFLKLT